MKKLAFMLLTIVSFAYGGDYKYIVTSTDQEIGKCYINTNPRNITVYQDGYKFWYKCISKRTLFRAQVKLKTTTEQYCLSTYYFTDNFDKKGTFHPDFDDLCQSPYDKERWVDYSTDNVFIAFQQYLDSKYQNTKN